MADFQPYTPKAPLELRQAADDLAGAGVERAGECGGGVRRCKL